LNTRTCLDATANHTPSLPYSRVPSRVRAPPFGIGSSGPAERPDRKPHGRGCAQEQKEPVLEIYKPKPHVMTVNVAFLRSGAQFVSPDKLAAASPAVSPACKATAETDVQLVTATAGSGASVSKHLRLEQLYQRMLDARKGETKAAPWRVPGLVTEASVPVPVLNVAFLKRGVQFGSHQDADAGAAADRPTKYSRLERFYAMTLAARETKRTVHIGPTPLVAPPANTLVTPRYQFMWASDTLETTPAPRTPETARLSKTQRLARFHARTQQAAAIAAGVLSATVPSSTEQRTRAMATATVGPESSASSTAPPSLSRPVATMVNLAFLRSGAEFQATNCTTTAALQLDSCRSVRLTRHQKLEQFYARTLDARKPATVPSEGTTATATSPPHSPLSSPPPSSASHLTRSQRRSLRATVGM